MTVNPTMSLPPTAAAPAKDVSSPFTGHASEPLPSILDRAQLSTAAAPPEPSASASPHLDGRLAGLVAASLAGLLLVGAAAPVVTAMMSPPPTSIAQVAGPVSPEQIFRQLPTPGALSDQAASQAVPPGAAKPAQPTDPVTLISTLAVYSEASAQQLPKAVTVQQQWGADVSGMQATTNGVFDNVDSLMRNPGRDAEQHHQAIDQGIARLSAQLGAFQQRLTQEGPIVDHFLGENRDNLNQAGTVAFNARQSVDQAAARSGLFTPQRDALGRLAGSFYDASKNLAMATEKTTDARTEQQALSQDVQTIQKFLAQVQQANQKSRTDANAMATVDKGTQVLRQALKVTQALISQQEKDVQAASTQAHQGATHLVDALQQIAPASAAQTEAAAQH